MPRGTPPRGIAVIYEQAAKRILDERNPGLFSAIDGDSSDVRAAMAFMSEVFGPEADGQGGTFFNDRITALCFMAAIARNP